MVSPLEERLGVVIEKLTATGCGRMPVENNTQIADLLHRRHLRAEGWVDGARTDANATASCDVDINATHHRSARKGWVIGVARLYLGSKTATYEIVVSDEQGTARRRGSPAAAPGTLDSLAF